MKIIIADVSDALIIHELMIKAFMEYENSIPPSSALDETVQSVSKALEEGEKALICYLGDEPVGMIRFRIKEDSVYFYRLSVIPKKQGHGIARRILQSLEDYSNENGIITLLCQVRMTTPKNIEFYISIGYHISNEEIILNPNGVSVKVVSMEKQLT